MIYIAVVFWDLGFSDSLFQQLVAKSVSTDSLDYKCKSWKAQITFSFLKKAQMDLLLFSHDHKEKLEYS